MTRLAQIKNEHSVEILYAIESGSRAWGFESQDSDYDVRFIYRHPKNWYLNILPKRDVIEYPIIDLFDYSGWDLRKSLFLMNKSNPVLFEWLASPIVYIKKEKEYSLLKDASEKYFSPISSIYHYLHMAEGNKRKKSGIELGIEPKIPEINLFIDEKIEHFRKFASSYNPSDKPSSSYLDDVFLQILDS